jgi:glutamine synthetase
LATDTGVNLLAPGKTPRTNLMFLTFFVNTIKAVHDHADLLRGAIASSTNDHRLGANEAPPAIISIFIGDYLTKVLNEVESRVTGKFTEQDEALLKLDIHKNIPELIMDNTDRNRTSPFAFTGNKFEFRAVGSSANCAQSMTVLNTIMAQTLITFKSDVDALVKKGEKKEVAVMQILRKYISGSKKILFEGDNYSEEWAKEAKKRGLNNFKDTPRALDVFGRKEVKALFAKMGIFNETESDARHEIQLEEYIKKVQIEARMMGYIASNFILPSAIQYQNRLIQNIKGMKDIGLKPESYRSQKDIVTQMSIHINAVSDNVEKMIEERKKVNAIADTHKRAYAYCDKIKPFFDVIRYNADKLELMVDDSMWQLPKYRELLYMR